MNVLAIDGGGVRGIVPATILDRWDTEGDRKVQERFQLFAGASNGRHCCGGSGGGRFRRAAAGTVSERDSGDLYAAARRLLPAGSVVQGFGFSGLLGSAASNRARARSRRPDAWRLSRPLVIASLDVVSGNPKIFRSGHFKEGAGDRSVKLVDAILASAAAPVLFPSVRVGGSTYVDGSLWANNPALLAMIEAGSLSDEPANILSLGCGRPRWGGRAGLRRQPRAARLGHAAYPLGDDGPVRRREFLHAPPDRSGPLLEDRPGPPPPPRLHRKGLKPPGAANPRRRGGKGSRPEAE